MLALVLLLVFTISCTPRQFLHDALADHRDVSASGEQGGTTVQPFRFQCGFDHPVVEAPYAEPAPLLVAAPALQVPEHRALPLPFVLLKNVRATVNKGPPAGIPA